MPPSARSYPPSLLAINPVWLQFLFLTAGWWVAHEMWRLVRPDTPTDTDLAGLQDFLLSDESGLIGAAIGMGYVSTL